jgi:DNA helicase HerA-like ATPase
MIRLKNTDILIVAGERGTGKSTLAMHFARMFPRYVVYDALGEYGEKGFENVYVPTSAEPEEFEMFCSKCWDLGNIMIVVDEAETFMPEGRKLTPSAFKIIMQGRHRNIGMIVTTKRIAELKKTVVSQAKYVILFRHFLPSDIDYIRTFTGNRAYELKDLKDHRFMVYSLGEFNGPFKINM